MTEVDWEAPDGRKYRMLVPDHDLDHPERGIVLGPPDLTRLGLPFDMHVRLHNHLWARQIYTSRDLDRRRIDAIGALQATLAVDVERIYQEYVAAEPPPPKPSSARADASEGVAVSTSEGVRMARQRAQVERQQRAAGPTQEHKEEQG